jgi:hypothetical protein
VNEQLMDTLLSPVSEPSILEASEESLVTDARAGLTPSQMVERKLLSLLKSSPLPLSHVHRLGCFKSWRN